MCRKYFAKKGPKRNKQTTQHDAVTVPCNSKQSIHISYYTENGDKNTMAQICTKYTHLEIF